MRKKVIAIFFTTLFMALITAPAVILALNDSFDTSIFYSVTEEEESGKYKNLFSPFSLNGNDQISQFSQIEDTNFSYQFKHYPKPHLNLISPPPELSILL